ncbi:MAG: transcriptional repressor [Gammaproteobacteria bacterium]|nr:transcriptional repressor [Gammaproteobacteria bacterium]MDE2251622.1 transcriptional repressor [Gammaproteobacteria bacterium]
MTATPQHSAPAAGDVTARLQARGIRATAQRLQIATLLLGAPQHLSAEQIAEALQARGVALSKATVYNTLNLFAARGLIRQLAVDDRRSWFDSNVEPHYHFHDEVTGALTDVALPEVEFSRLPPIPAGMEVASLDLVIRLRPKG